MCCDRLLNKRCLSDAPPTGDFGEKPAITTQDGCERVELSRSSVKPPFCHLFSRE